MLKAKRIMQGKRRVANRRRWQVLFLEFNWIDWLGGIFAAKATERRKSPRLVTRRLSFEPLEPKLTLSGVPTFAEMLAAATPDPHPTGDQPPSSIQSYPLSYYNEPPPITGLTYAPAQTYFDELQAVEDTIASTSADRPSVWGENVATAANQYRLHLNDNGMLVSGWLVDWGDGTSPQSVSPVPWVVHQYAAAGDYSITVTAYSIDGSYSTSGSSFTDFVGIGGSSPGLEPSFPDVAPTVQVASAQTVAAGQVFSLANEAGLNYPGVPPNPITASADWDDGSNPDILTVTPTAAGGVGSPYMATLSGQHVYTEPGTYYVTITAANGSLSDTQEIPVTVVPLTTTISGLNSGNTYNEGDTASLSGNLSDGTTNFSTMGDPVTYNWQVQDASGNVLATSTDPTLNYAFGDDGTYVISLTASQDGVAGTTDTETITVDPEAPVTTSTSSTIYANVGQPVTLPPVTFTQDGLNDVHTATVNWDTVGNAIPLDNSAQITEETFDGTTLTPGSVTDSYAYSAIGNYTVTVTIYDDAGLYATRTYTVDVATAAITLTGFSSSSDHSALSVSYTVANADSAPFSIGIYTSPDGTTPDQLLTSYTVTDSSLLAENTGTPYSVTIPTTFSDPQQDYQLIAVADSGGTDGSTLEFPGGIFTSTDPTVGSSQVYVQVFGAPGGSTPIDITSSTITEGSNSFGIPSNATAIHIRAENPGNTITVDPSMTLQTWQYADGVQDTLTVTPDNNVPLTNLVLNQA
jgi:hypothetical protein